MVRCAASLSPAERPRHLDVPAPLVFPEEAEVAETQLHFELRILLYQLLCDHLGLEATIGSDQFVYYDGADPQRSVAPDVYVQLRPSTGKIRSWKTWERGAPDIAVEIVSESDASEEAWTAKLQRYHSVGVVELVRFDPEAPEGHRLRVWHRADGKLLEREIESSRCRSMVADLHWVVGPAETNPVTLRIAAGDAGQVLVPTRVEARQAEAEARQAEAEARQAAEARVRELEAELRRRS
jgi:Uma2 family endonuclease